MGIQHQDVASDFHYSYDFPENNGTNVNPLIGQRHMFKLVAPLVTPLSPGIQALISISYGTIIIFFL